MKTIGLISDTHSFLHPSVMEYLSKCDEIWHAGDIGDIETAKALASLKSFRAVYGNIDDGVVRSFYPLYQDFFCEDIRVLILHIGGYPGKYNKQAKELINELKPGLFISGHSHILKVINDPKNNLLHLNPGAAGKSGFHNLITAMKFVVDGKNIRDLEILEIDKK
ncbi:MAG TPA: metallophosphoesterase family protein [Lentimicrobium sp.]|nr:metallophosphoesterase family protein [Lentimicrobium sp.]